MDKYLALVEARQACRVCIECDPQKIAHAQIGPNDGLAWPGDYNEVSHWAQRLGSREPKLVIVGNDFNDWESYRQTGGRVYRGTNDNLDRLLEVAGVQVDSTVDNRSAAPVYLTNSILCLKAPNTSVKTSWVKTCSSLHLIPLLRLLNPKIVVGMGVHGWSAVRIAYSLTNAPKSLMHAAGQSWSTSSGIVAYAVGHCSSLGLVSRRWEIQVEDWRQIGKLLL